MRVWLSTVVASAGLASAAHAVDNTHIDWQVSLDNATWQSTVDALPGQTVYARAVVSYIGTQSPFGLAAFVFQPIVSNWDLVGSGSSVDTLLPFVNGGVGSNTSTPPGVVTDPSDPAQFGRISPWGRSATNTSTYIGGHLHSNGSGGAPPGAWLRIAQAQSSSWIGGVNNTTGSAGVNIAQLSNVGRTTSDPAFNGSLSGIQVFKFGVVLSLDGAPRTMTIDSPPNGFGQRNTSTGGREVYWWLDMNEASGSGRGTPTVTPALISVSGDLIITGSPTSQTVEAGTNVSFSVTTVGDAADFQWRRNGNGLADGSNISGARTRVLTITPADIPDAGTYDVVVSTSHGAHVTSAPATLTVNCPVPRISTQPASVRASPCQTVVYGVEAGSYYALAYRWRRNGVNLNDGGRISGANTPTLTISPVGFFLGGNYDVVITNSCASTTSNTVLLDLADPTDYDGDGDVGTDADIEAFFACLAGRCCPACLGADINGDGDIGTDADIEAFFRILGGGGC